MHIINYWCQRCTPLLGSKSKKKVYFLAANRCGKEKNIVFIGKIYFYLGSSCILKLGSKPQLVDNLNKIENNTIYSCLKLNEK